MNQDCSQKLELARLLPKLAAPTQTSDPYRRQFQMSPILILAQMIRGFAQPQFDAGNMLSTRQRQAKSQ
jgi:hypothetical protein